MIQLSGAYTALITPFTADGSSVDLERLRANVVAQAEAGIAGVVPCGTTGETPTLDEREHRAVIEAAIDAGHRAGLAVIPGAGSNSTAHAIELHRFVAEAGADAALHVCPYYNKPSQAGLEAHFRAIADAADLPIVLYNIPGRCGVGLEIETIERLAAHPRIVAIKEATGSLLLAGRIAVETDLVLLSGDDPLTLPIASVGGAGVISVLSNLLPDRVAALCVACAARDWAAAERAHRELLPLAHAVLTLDTNPVPIKTALALQQRDTGAVRLPLVAASEETRERLRRVLATHAPRLAEMAV